jgi:hypothetical protein
MLQNPSNLLFSGCSFHPKNRPTWLKLAAVSRAKNNFPSLSTAAAGTPLSHLTIRGKRLHDKSINFFDNRRIYEYMSWWKMSIEGNKRIITICSFNWRLCLAMLPGGILTGFLFCAFVWMKSLLS